MTQDQNQTTADMRELSANLHRNAIGWYPDAADALLQAADEIERLRAALMSRIQTENFCMETASDCGVRSGGRPCSCALEMQAELESVQ